MALPAPEPGLVFRYDYVWLRETDARRKPGKERPACLVAALDVVDRRLVAILPITHTKPTAATAAIEIPAAVKRKLGLDDARAWVIVSEANIDDWPNAGLAPIPGKAGTFAYGFMPPGLFAVIKATFLANLAQRRAKTVRR
ncbi:MAG TPA: hypothetical protein VHU87_15355 [Rhizomicrobium sp.]|jgi:hypothetical protein|nr:hypothetical protein [Rhizomicrobium sp.]